MPIDKDGVITLLIGLLLLVAAWGVEYFFFAGHNCVQAIVNLFWDIIIGGIAAVGLLLIIVGILFMTAW